MDTDAYRERKAAYARTPDQRAKRTEYMRRWRENNRARHNEIGRESYARHRDKVLAARPRYYLKSTYGITLEDFEAMVLAQGGGCAICGATTSSPRRPRLHVDHCHKTGAIRGALCSRCNGALGWFEKYRDSIISYVDEDRCW